ncbi:glycine cleavage system H-protein, partial [Lipomyces japonicus]|uniref:glycine cleavage system H-protein n=1 Tax=Lipomyces japonicus TaxID=56871 RepID=UPI0034CE11CA
KFTEEHEWIAVEDGQIAVIGISKYAADALGDVVYVELPQLGSKIGAGEPIGAIESVKSASDIYSPLTGEVIEINDKLEGKPGLINAEPYNKGWIAKIKFDNTEELDQLLDNTAYLNFLA